MDSLQYSASSIDEVVAALSMGVEHSFSRRIKGLTFEKRRLKLVRYLHKKKRRVWRKRLNYDCRKQVADERLRLKGKFVTHEQACSELGLTTFEDYTPDEIK
jgi:hypothetical protein